MRSKYTFVMFWPNWPFFGYTPHLKIIVKVLDQPCCTKTWTISLNQSINNVSRVIPTSKTLHSWVRHRHRLLYVYITATKSCGRAYMYVGMRILLTILFHIIVEMAHIMPNLPPPPPSHTHTHTHYTSNVYDYVTMTSV